MRFVVDDIINHLLTLVGLTPVIGGHLLVAGGRFCLDEQHFHWARSITCRKFVFKSRREAYVVPILLSTKQELPTNGTWDACLLDGSLYQLQILGILLGPNAESLQH